MTKPKRLVHQGHVFHVKPIGSGDFRCLHLELIEPSGNAMGLPAWSCQSMSHAITRVKEIVLALAKPE